MSSFFIVSLYIRFKIMLENCAYCGDEEISRIMSRISVKNYLNKINEHSIKNGGFKWIYYINLLNENRK